MCQAIVKPAKIRIGKKTLKLAWADNSDGAGFAVRQSFGFVEIHKGFFTFKTFLKAYRKFEHLDCLIHFRYATHGEKVTENCHPFALRDEGALIHNGILAHFLPNKLDTRSDTRVLVEEFLLPAIESSGLSVAEFCHAPENKAFIESMIGHNKIAMLTTNGFSILNEVLGEWSGGAWYSAGKPMPYIKPKYAPLYDMSARNYQRAMLSDYATSCAEKDPWEEEMEAWGEEEPTSLRSDDLLPASDEDDMCVVCLEQDEELFQLGSDLLCSECWRNCAL